MSDFSNVVDRIVAEWAARVSNGAPDPANPVHVDKLGDALTSLGVDPKLKGAALNQIRNKAQR